MRSLEAMLIGALAGVVIVGAASWAGTALGASVTATPATLDAMLKVAKCGDTVTLVAGQTYPGSRGLTGKACAGNPITLDARGATISGLHYHTKVSGLRIIGGQWSAGLRFDDAADLGIDAGLFDWPTTTAGLTLIRTKSITVTGSTFRASKAGISGVDNDGLRIEGNHFDRLRADGVVLGRPKNIIIRGNRCDAAPVITGADHPDCFQMYGAQGWQISDVLIEGNTMTGMAQGVFLGDHMVAPYYNVTIRRNTATVGMVRAISLSACAGVCRVEANTVTTQAGAQWQSGIFVPGSVARCGNTVSAYGGKPGVTDPACIVRPTPAELAKAQADVDAAKIALVVAEKAASDAAAVMASYEAELARLNALATAP